MRKISSIFIMIVSSFVILCGCNKTEMSKPDPEPKILSEGELTLGEWNENKYTNAFFGFSFEAPEEYNILTQDEIVMLLNLDLEMLGIESDHKVPSGDLNNEESLHLAYILKYPMTHITSPNPNIEFIAENLKVYELEDIVDNGSQFLSLIKDFHEVENSGFDFPKEIYETKVDGITFYVLEMILEWDDLTITNRYYAKKINNFMFTILVTSSNDEDYKEINSIIDTISFTKQ